MIGVSGQKPTLSTLLSAIRDLGVPLYECGILVHCLPYHGSWLWGRITDDTDRTGVPST